MPAAYAWHVRALRFRSRLRLRNRHACLYLCPLTYQYYDTNERHNIASILFAAMHCMGHAKSKNQLLQAKKPAQNTQGIAPSICKRIQKRAQKITNTTMQPENKPYSEIKTATKQLVDALLAMNTNNRSLRTGTVKMYAEDIKSGKWMLTNQGIGITKSGVLADGQHRLEAIKSCGYPPVQLLIVHGLEESVQIAVDAHAKRSARDMLHFAFGYRVSRSAPAIGNIILKYKQNKWFGGFTNSQLMESIRDYADEIEIITNAPKNASFFAAPFLASFVMQLQIRPDLRNEILAFMAKVETGEMLDKTMPEYHLRNYIATSTKMKGGGEMQKERLVKCTKALTASLKGEKMGALRYN